jgi:hypothetical protein
MLKATSLSRVIGEHHPRRERAWLTAKIAKAQAVLVDANRHRAPSVRIVLGQLDSIVVDTITNFIGKGGPFAEVDVAKNAHQGFDQIGFPRAVFTNDDGCKLAFFEVDLDALEVLEAIDADVIEPHGYRETIRDVLPWRSSRRWPAATSSRSCL